MLVVYDTREMAKGVTVSVLTATKNSCVDLRVLIGSVGHLVLKSSKIALELRIMSM